LHFGVFAVELRQDVVVLVLFCGYY